MKNMKLILAVAIFATISFVNNYAAEKTISRNDNMLTKEISNVFYSIPMGELMSEDVDSILVQFQITPEREFKLINVVGKNEELVRYTKIVLNNKNFEIDATVEPKFYDVPIKFVCK